MAKLLTPPPQRSKSTSQQRFYTPLSILDQTVHQENDEVERISPDKPVNIHTTTSKLRKDTDEVDHDFHQTTDLVDTSAINFAQKGVICRQLGAAEHMYHVSVQTGSEILCLGTEIATVYPICNRMSEKALVNVLRRHTMLRLDITPDPSDEDRFVFRERRPLKYDFSYLEHVHWLDVLLKETRRPFCNNGQPLFRCRMLKPCGDIRNIELGPPHSENEMDNFKFRTQFLFIAHHSVFDGGYSIWIFQEFINFLDDLIIGTSKRTIKEIPLVLPMESFLPTTGVASSLVKQTVSALPDTSNISIKYGHNPQETSVLEAYIEKYNTEIQNLTSTQPRHGALCFKMSPSETRRFRRMCKSNGSSTTALMAAGSILSLLDLIFETNHTLQNVQVPIEYLVDLRKFYEVPGCTEHYAGLSTGHVPITIQISRYETQQRSSMLLEVSSKLSDVIKDVNIYTKMVLDIHHAAEQLKKDPNYQIPRGKSSGVLCISYMGNCDHVFNNDVSERVRLVGLNGFSSVLVDDMPLFVTNTVLVNGRLQGNVSYCETYTSKTTAGHFLDLMMSYLTCASLL